MKISHRASIELTLDAILLLLRARDVGQQLPSELAVVVATVEGDAQTARVTNENPLVLSWDKEVEL